MPNLNRRPVFDSITNRQPAVAFFTSSISKFLQAKIIFEKVGLRLIHRRNDDDAYHESYDGTKEDLLTRAMAEIRRRGGASGSFFFIEDTSIRIEALSSVDDDVPGLSAKEWFQKITFEELDCILKEHGERRACVKSCVALFVPGLTSPLFFYGSTHGEVARQPASFETNPFYPWLSADNFSGWLIPNGCSSTLSELSFEASLKFDFRVEAITSMIDRLEEYAVVMNASPPMYYRPHLASVPQPSLFPIEKRPTILVIGPTCSGKTTLGAYVQQNLDWQVVDASSVVRSLRDIREASEIDIADFAHDLLDRQGADVVAREISERFGEPTLSNGLIVTGFRAIEEIELFREKHENVKVISVEAPERLRYDRYVRRGTRRKMNTLIEFRAYDQRQHELGLLRVAAELADIRISNVYSIDSFYSQIGHVLGGDADSVPGITRVQARLDPERSQLYRCLGVLRDAGRPLTTQEIESVFQSGRAVRYNNANKMLKRYPELARRLEGPGVNVKYQITSHGLAFLGAVDRRNSHGYD
jgi:dephospho-CoA kinase/inosine/xanthosine triphosphate pyrophosphatase family protein